MFMCVHLVLIHTATLGLGRQRHRIAPYRLSLFCAISRRYQTRSVSIIFSIYIITISVYQLARLKRVRKRVETLFTEADISRDLFILNRSNTLISGMKYDYYTFYIFYIVYFRTVYRSQ